MLSQVLQVLKVLLSVASAALPLVEQRWFAVLPVTDRLRGDVLPVAVLAAVGAAVAGTVTARQTAEGLSVGWTSLIVFMATAIGFYGALDYFPRAASGLYVVFFASFTLSVSSFLSSRLARR